jgi:hypothetical protein
VTLSIWAGPTEKPVVGGGVVAEQASDVEENLATAVTAFPGAPHDEEHNPGRPISWLGTSIVIVGFVVGGIGFVPAPHWTIFWIGAGVAIIGCLILLFAKTMSEDWY